MIKSSCRKRARFALVLLCSTVLVSCSLIDPYVEPPAVLKENAATSLQGVVDYGWAMRDAYRRGIKDQAILNSSVGLALIPITAIAAYYGITGGHANTVLGLGLGGAGAYIGAQYLHSEPRQLIYAAGATATTCAITVMEPARTATQMLANEGGSLQDRLRTLQSAKADFSAAVTTFGRDFGTDAPELSDAQALLDDAATMLTSGNQAETMIQSSRTTLYDALFAIDDLVAKALIAEEPNMEALFSSLGTALPLRASQLTNQKAISEKPKAPTGPKLRVERDVAVAKYNQARDNLVASTLAVRQIVSLFTKHTPEESLRACIAGIEEAGQTFQVTPEGTITFGNKAKPESAGLSVRGGQPEYVASWVGVKPDGIKATTAPSANWDGSGVVTVEETVNAPADGHYYLLINDVKGHQVVVDVVVANSGNSASTESQGSNAPASDPKISKLQTLLKNAGHDPKKTDGIFGPDTLAAIRSYRNNAAMTEAEAKADIDKIISELEPAGGAASAGNNAGTGPAMSAEEAEFMTRAFSVLFDRKCLASPGVPANTATAQSLYAAAIQKVQAQNPGLPESGEDTIGKLEADPTLTCHPS